MPNFVISGATSGDNTVIAAVTGKQFRITSLWFITAGAVDVRFESGASGTALTGIMSFAANGGMVLPHNPDGWFTNAVSTLLNMELGGAVQVSGGGTYDRIG